MKNLKRLAALMMAAILTLALSVTVFAAVEDTGFSDVSADSWHAGAVMYCREHSLMFGTSDNLFQAGITDGDCPGPEYFWDY